MTVVWETKKLGELCNFENGDRGTNYPSKSSRSTNGIPFINAGHLRNGSIDMKSMDYISRERYNLLGSGKIQNGDILFCLRGSLGKYAIVTELFEGAIASSLVIVRSKPGLLVKYLAAYFESKLCSDMIIKYSNGAAQPNLSAGSLKQFIIPLPPLPEQQRIVALLDQAFSGIATAKKNAEKNLNNARELFEIYLNDVFLRTGGEWVQNRLDEVLQRTEKTNPLAKPETPFEYVDVSSVDNKRFVVERATTLFGKDAPSRARKVIRKGDVVFATVRPTLKRIAIIPDNLDGQVCSTGYFVLRPKIVINNRLLFYFLQTNQFLGNMERLQKGASYPAVTENEVKEQIISYPKQMKQQLEIVSKLDALKKETSNLVENYQKKITGLEYLRKAILQKAFAGELTVG